MNILVIGGMHGNEPLGLEVVRLLRIHKSSIDTILANERAIKKDVRFTDADLNRSFPGNMAGKTYESRRAASLLRLCSKYDLVLDFHNTHCPDNDCTFVGKTAATKLLDVSAWLGLSRVIVADYDCINKYAPNCMSIEISLGGGRMDAAAWVARIEQLAGMDTIPPAEGIQKYRFVYRMTLEDEKRLALRKQGLQAFKPLPENLADKLKVVSPAYPIFVADEYTPYNFGGILNRIEI